MAYANDDVLISSTAAHNRSGDPSGTQTVLMDACAAAIQTAVTAGNFTCTLSLSGKASQDIQFLLEALHNSGYTTSISSTTLTINW